MPPSRSRRRGCATCSASVSHLLAVRWEGRRFCSRACMASARVATEKARHDLRESGVVCRCPGAPRPLAATGRHCADCRRLFSAGVRSMLAEEARAGMRWTRRLALRLEALALTPVHLPRLPQRAGAA